MKEEIILAGVSIGLYGSLSLTSWYFFIRYLLGTCWKQEGEILAEEKSVTGNFRKLKMLFFFAMAMSSSADLPLYVACILESGPSFCHWGNSAYSITWSLHIMALSGYEVCLGIPLYMWSQIVTGHSVNTKLLMIGSAISYFLLQVLTIACVFSNYDPSGDSFETDPLNSSTVSVEAIYILLLAGAWLWYGIRLQLYVRSLGTRMEGGNTTLFKSVNGVMVMVVLCYMIRAICILILSINGTILVSYLEWLFFSRWLPYVFCSYLLIYLLRNKSISSAPEGAHTETIRNSLFGEYYKRSSESGCSDSSDVIIGTVNRERTSSMSSVSISGSSASIISQRSDWSDVADLNQTFSDDRGKDLNLIVSRLNDSLL